MLLVFKGSTGYASIPGAAAHFRRVPDGLLVSVTDVDLDASAELLEFLEGWADDAGETLLVSPVVGLGLWLKLHGFSAVNDQGYLRKA